MLGSGEAFVTYTVGTYDTAQETVTLPWRKTFPWGQDPSGGQVIAQLHSTGEITCRIIRGTTVLKEVRSNGAYVAAHCTDFD